MGRKKKEIVKKEFIPSKYQQAIFDFIDHDVGNLVIEACAGSGKSTTLIQIISRLPQDKSVLFCAFNKDIVKELSKKVDKSFTNVDIRTVHSLGYLMLQRNFKDKSLSINENKYREFIFNNLNDITRIDLSFLTYKEKIQYIDNIVKLVDFSRYNLAESEKEILILAERHDISLLGDEINACLDVMEWGRQVIDEVDYTDMVWLPNTLLLKPLGLLFDYILADECQDFSVAQRELILRCVKKNTRMVYVGDKKQCLYSFASASPESFDKIKALPNTTSLPLSISYRCPKNIVKFAQTIVKEIEYNENNLIEGDIKYNSRIDEINDGDMVLCRNNAPLMKIYSELIREGKKCKIRGKDIGLNLKKIVKHTKQEELNADLLKDGVFVRLYDDLFSCRDKMITKSGLDLNTIMNDSIIVNKLDMIKALEVLSEGLKTSDELLKKIDEMFSDRKNVGVSLSTIHKAKGLEADNVFIACPSLMPCKSATKDWEIEQEYNLMYVAYTRAKNKLCFLDESEFKKFNENNNELKSIEIKVNDVLGKKNNNIVFDSIKTKDILNRIKTIERPKIGLTKNLSESSFTSNKTSSDLSNLFNNRFKKSKRK